MKPSTGCTPVYLNKFSFKQPSCISDLQFRSRWPVSVRPTHAILSVFRAATLHPNEGQSVHRLYIGKAARGRHSSMSPLMARQVWVTAAEKTAFRAGWDAAAAGKARSCRADYLAYNERAAFNDGWDSFTRKAERQRNRRLCHRPDSHEVALRPAQQSPCRIGRPSGCLGCPRGPWTRHLQQLTWFASPGQFS